MPQDVSELYESIGGDQPFYDLVNLFYEGVESDAPLRSLYPESLTAGKQHLAWFLIQRFGGPQHFNNHRGAPRLRMRHAEFAITRDQAKRWFRHMASAADAMPIFAPHRDLILRYFEDSAIFLINSEPSGEVSIVE